MIAYIKGTVEQLTDQTVILENQGIGYIINASPTTLSRMPSKGETATIHTYMHVTENSLSLFGFMSQEEIQMFNLLITVSGIGPKAATSILASLTPEGIVLAIASEDTTAFTKVSGVGKKTAQRIILELQEKIAAPGETKWAKWATENVASNKSLVATNQPEKQDAIEALVSLGYNNSESLRAVLSVATEDMQASQIIKLALKKLSV